MFTTPNYYITWDQTAIDGTNTAGIQTIDSSATSVTVSFAQPMTNTDYTIGFTIENLVDSVIDHFLCTITSKDVNGFTVTFSNAVSTANYRLAWTAFEYARIPHGSLTPQSGWHHIPNGASSFTVPISMPYELFDNYTVTMSIVNTDDITSSQYGMVVKSKDIFGFTVLLSSPIDSGNYYLSWALPLSATAAFDENFIFRQTGQMRDFDVEGTFDCTHGMDQVDIEVEELINYLLQENGDYILLQGVAAGIDGSRIIL